MVYSVFFFQKIWGLCGAWMETSITASFIDLSWPFSLQLEDRTFLSLTQNEVLLFTFLTTSVPWLRLRDMPYPSELLVLLAGDESSLGKPLGPFSAMAVLLQRVVVAQRLSKFVKEAFTVQTTSVGTLVSRSLLPNSGVWGDQALTHRYHFSLTEHTLTSILIVHVKRGKNRFNDEYFLEWKRMIFFASYFGESIYQVTQKHFWSHWRSKKEEAFWPPPKSLCTERVDRKGLMRGAGASRVKFSIFSAITWNLHFYVRWC